jgi:hypothetical protein
MSGGKLALDDTTGSWRLSGGTIRGGTISGADGAKLVFTSSGGTLVGVTLNTDITVSDGDTVTALEVLTLNGTVQVSSGGKCNVDGMLVVGGSGIIAGEASGLITIAGSLLGATTDADRYNPQVPVRFDGAGTVTAPQLLEAMGRDVGNTLAGFTRNFVYSTLSLGNNTYVKLVDQADNATGTEHEALYVDSLIVPAGTTIDLNGLHLYARGAQIVGTVVGGTVTLAQAPTDISLSGTTIAENVPAATLVGLLSTTDPDPGDTFIYTLLDSAGGRFKIVDDQLQVDNGLLLDHEAAASHTIRVRTTDLGGTGLSYDEDLTITVTDVNETPTHIGLSGSSVPENCGSGTLVGLLSTTDPDPGDTFSYTLLDSAGGYFKIVDDQLQVTNGLLLDYEAATSHTIRVRTTDLGGTGLSYEQDLVIAVTDVHDFASVALFDPASSFFYVRCSNTGGEADYTFGYGEPNGDWIVLKGDWNGDGVTGVGLYDPKASTFYLTNALKTGFAEYTFGYGEAEGGWIPLVGDWDGNGTAGVGLYDPKSSTFY